MADLASLEHRFAGFIGPSRSDGKHQNQQGKGWAHRVSVSGDRSLARTLRG
jgi:hypothetical protein